MVSRIDFDEKGSYNFLEGARRIKASPRGLAKHAKEHVVPSSKF